MLPQKNTLKLVFYFCEWDFSASTCCKKTCHNIERMLQKYFKRAIFLKKYRSIARMETIIQQIQKPVAPKIHND